MRKTKLPNKGVFKGDRLLDSKDVCKVLGVKPSTLANWVCERKIPFVKLGPGRKAMLKFEPEKLNEWLEECSRDPINLASFTI